MRFAELREARHGVVDTRRMQLADQRGWKQTLTIELALAEMQSHPVREVRDRGIDRPAGHGADREPHGRQPRILVHHVRFGGVRRGFKILQGEADRHAKLVGQPCAYEGLIALSAEPLDEEASDVVAKIAVLPGRADIAAQFEMPHEAQHLRSHAIARNMHPVMARQSGLMTQEVAHRDPLGRHRIVQAKLRHVVPHRLGPVETPLIVQERHTGRGERFGDRADQELRRGCNGQVRFNVALTVGLRQRHLAVLHHGKSCAWHFPVGHGGGGKAIELREQTQDRRGARFR